MVEIRNTTKGSAVKIVQDGNTVYVYVTDLMNKIWDDYIRSVIDNVYARGLLKDLQFTDTQVFHMIEQLQIGRREYDNYVYTDVMYE